jgi:hypothetical protein
MTEPEKFKKRQFWLDGFDGPAKGGLHYRSKIAIEIEDVETKFGVKIVAIGIEPDYESGAASWTIEFLTEVTEEEVN